MLKQYSVGEMPTGAVGTTALPAALPCGQFSERATILWCNYAAGQSSCFVSRAIRSRTALRTSLFW
jgi:hypothetical protein